MSLELFKCTIWNHTVCYRLFNGCVLGILSEMASDSHVGRVKLTDVPVSKKCNRYFESKGPHPSCSAVSMVSYPAAKEKNWL